MFDFLRNLTKTEEEKQQETLSAYLDDALTPREKEAFEAKLREDTILRASLEQQRLVKQNISQLPRVRAPRNFTLDPAAYGRPTPQTAFRLYPVLRAATVLAAILLISLFSLDIVTPDADQVETEAEAPIALSNVARDEESANTAAEPAPAAEVEMVEEQAGEAELAEEESFEEAEEPVEEAMEEEAAEAEEAMEEEPAEEEAFVPPAEPSVGEGAAAGEEAAADATKQQATEVATESPVTDGANATIVPSFGPTPTISLSPVPTQLPDSDTSAFSTTQTIPETETEAPVTAEPILPTIRILQIGLGILFLVLLTATWLIRQQL